MNTLLKALLIAIVLLLVLIGAIVALVNYDNSIQPIEEAGKRPTDLSSLFSKEATTVSSSINGMAASADSMAAKVDVLANFHCEQYLTAADCWNVRQIEQDLALLDSLNEQDQMANRQAIAGCLTQGLEDRYAGKIR